MSAIDTEERVPGQDVPIGAAFPWAHRQGRLGPWLASLWLVFLVPAFVDGWQDRHEASGMVGMVATAARAAPGCAR